MFGILYRLCIGIKCLISTCIYCFIHSDKCEPLNIKEYKRINEVKSNPNVPKFLFQVHKSEYLSWNIYAHTLQIIYMNPTYEYKFYSNDDARVELVNIFGSKSKQVKAYDKCICGAYKADIFRLCMLYERGGVYMDCKSSTILPLDLIIPQDSDLTFVLDMYCKPRVDNSFIACCARNKVIKKLMDEAIDRVLNEKFGITPLDVAGPDMFGTVLYELFGEDNFKIGNFIFDDYKVYFIGKKNMWNYYLYGNNGPFIKKIPDSSNWMDLKRLSTRYDIEWVLGRAFNK